MSTYIERTKLSTRSIDLGLPFFLSPYYNVYSPSSLRTHEVCPPFDIHYGSLLPRHLLAFFCGTDLDPRWHPFQNEGNDNIEICSKTDRPNGNAASAGVDTHKHFECLLRLRRRLDELCYLRLTNKLVERQSKRSHQCSADIRSDGPFDRFAVGRRMQASRLSPYICSR